MARWIFIPGISHMRQKNQHWILIPGPGWYVQKWIPTQHQWHSHGLPTSMYDVKIQQSVVKSCIVEDDKWTTLLWILVGSNWP
jgi:hypothetical protein